MRIMSFVVTTAVLAFSGQAMAHAHFNPSNVAPSYAGPMAIQIGHGCSGQATEKVTLYVPEGIVVSPVAKPGWLVSSIETNGRVSRIVWSGNSLASSQKDEFAFAIVAPVNQGAVSMAVKQECANGELFWQDTAAKASFPVPRFNVRADAMADEHDDHDHHDHAHGHDHSHSH